MLIDLSHTLVSGMPVYPGDSIPHVQQSAWVEKEGFAHFDLTIGVHAGTHMDGPAHMIAGGRKLCDFPIERFIVPAKLADLHLASKGSPQDAPFEKGGQGDFQITEADLEKVDLQPGDALIIRTDFSSHFNDPKYFTAYPVLTEEAAHSLVKKQIGLLGIDWPSPDTDPFPVHKILLGAEVLIIENLTNLAELAKLVSPLPRGSTRAERGGGSYLPFMLHALPMKVDADSAPVRVIAEI